MACRAKIRMMKKTYKLLALGVLLLLALGGAYWGLFRPPPRGARPDLPVGCPMPLRETRPAASSPRPTPGGARFPLCPIRNPRSRSLSFLRKRAPPPGRPPVWIYVVPEGSVVKGEIREDIDERLRALG